MGRREQDRIARQRVAERAARMSSVHPNLAPLAPPERSERTDLRPGFVVRALQGAPRTTYVLLSVLMFGGLIAAAHALNPSYGRGTAPLLAAAFVLSCAWVFFGWIAAARAVSLRLGLPVLICGVLAVSGYVVGAITQNVLEGRPVVVGTDLNAAVEYTAKLDAIGEAIALDRERYITSGELEGRATINEMPGAARKWAQTAKDLVRMSRTGMPDLSWRPATLLLAESADLLAKAIERRVDVLNSTDAAASADLVLINNELGTRLAASYQRVRQQAVRAGVERPNIAQIVPKPVTGQADTDTSEQQVP
jgi:hypothetical protein